MISDVPVIPATVLPESVMMFCFDLHHIQDFGSSFPQVVNCSARNRLLDGLKNIGNGVSFIPGEHEQVDMFRHDHVCPDMEVVLFLCFEDGIDEEEPGSFVVEKVAVPVARKRQTMGITGNVVVDVFLSPGGRFHWRSP